MKRLVWLAWLPFVSCVTYESTPLATKMMNDAFVTEFVRTNCGYDYSKRDNEPEKKRHECAQRWATAFTAKLEEIYPAADFKALRSRCENSQRPCEPEYLEQWAHDSHQDRTERQKMPASIEAGAPACVKVATPCD